MTYPACTIGDAYARLTAPGAPFEMREEQVGGMPLRTYVRALPTLREVYDRACAWGERPCLVFGDERISFAAQQRAVAHLAAAFAAAGLARGGRVAIAMRNLPEWAIAFWAAVAPGGIAVAINAWGTGDDLAYAVRDSGASVLVADAPRLAALGPRLGGLDLRLVIGARAEVLPPGAVALEALIGVPPDYGTLPLLDLPDAGIAPDDDATIFYTSGTTGRPKGALGTHRNMTTNLVNIGLRTARAALRRGDPLPAPDPAARRVTLLPTPLFHATGVHSGLVPAALAGTTTVLMHKWDAATALELVARERVNTIITVPTMSRQLIATPDDPARDLSSLDTITFGGAPAGDDLGDRLVERFPGIFIANGFGMTETSSVVASNSAEDLLARPDSVGTVMPCDDVRVVDEHGRDVPPGWPGELLVRGPNVIKGYWNRPDDTAAAMSDGWLRTGDIVRIDAEGFVYALDRAKDMIIRGGENIYCVEVEQAIARHPAVSEVAVLGLPDPLLGELVGAAVTLRAEVDDDELTRHAAAVLVRHKVPVRFFRVDGAMPRNATGKLMKRELKAMLGLAA